jgi:hypothetical protein
MMFFMPHTLRWILLGALAALALPGWSRNRIDPGTIARFGGTYAIECGNPAVPRVRVLPDTLTAERDNLRVIGGDPQASYNYLGPSAPRSFEVALVSQVGDDGDMVFMVSRDEAGYYIEIDGESKVRAALGPAAAGKKYRQCDGSEAMRR